MQHRYSQAENGINQYPDQQQQQYDRGQYQDQPEYERDNLVNEYGSIIKDLIDTEDLLLKFELRLLGKGKDPEGNIITIRDPLMDTEQVRDLMDMIKSVVNQNTHFTKFPAHVVENTLTLMGTEIPRWMLQQGNKVPRKNRATINLMAMNLINESLHKANDGTILRWSKGSFRDGKEMNPDYRKKGMFSFLTPWRK